MTRQETEKLFELLTALTITWKPKKNAALAWTLVLEPYDYETVKAAVISLQRKTNQIPLPAEIVAEIKALAPAPAAETEEQTDEPTPNEKRALARYAVLRKLRREHGLPETPSAARAYGMTAMQVMDEYDAAGLGCDAVARDFCARY